MKKYYALLLLVLFVIFSSSESQQNDPVLPLDVGIKAYGKVDQDRWVFYKFEVPANKGFTIYVEHGTGASKIHDIDVYIRKGGQLPDRNTYDYKDIGYYTNFTINGNAQLTDTLYVVGIFGFRGQNTPFHILFEYSNGCPADCNRHGSCVNGVCTCSKGYLGAYCQYSVSTITLGEKYFVSLERSAWLYYSVDIFVANNLLVSVTQSFGDVDLYIRYSDIPDFLHYQYSDFFQGNQFSINITQPNLGTWYLGFYGFLPTNFTFDVSEVRSCPMRCSLHGTCVGSYCRCSSAYVGLTCEEARNPLSLRQMEHGYVSENYWNFYKFIANSERSFNIIANHSSTANCDIFVLDGAKPTRFIYLYRNITLAPISNVVVNNPGFSTWWIGIFGTSSCEYNLMIEDYGSGPSNCAKCVNGHCTGPDFCECHGGWFGPACDVRPDVLTNGKKSAEIQITNGEWKYFNIDVANTSQLVVVLQEISTSGLVWVYISKETYPTLASYEDSDSHSGLSTHRLSLEFSLPLTLRFIIGVYGSPFIVQQEVKFSIVAYYPPF